MISLQNNHVEARFSTIGAELQSFKDKETGYEYLWSGNPAYWGKFSPVLFPIVGGLKDDSYYYNGEKYVLPRHGFAREKEFKAVQISATEVLFSLEQDAQTLSVYPFKFKLELHYLIQDKQLTCTYRVSNPDKKDLLFSVGAHPAFATPTNKELHYTDYFLTFNEDTQLTRHKIGNNLITDEIATVEMENQTLPLSHELFYEDALVMKSLKSDRISLKNYKNSSGLHFDFNGFPFFGIWSAKDADFVCLEPWCGIADSSSHNQNLIEKEGINSITPGSNWSRSWSVTSF